MPISDLKWWQIIVGIPVILALVGWGYLKDCWNKLFGGDR